MTPEKIKILQDSFDLVRPISDVASDLFYNRLFEIAPEVKPLFKGDMKEQGMKLMNALSVVVKGISQPEKIIPVLEKLGKGHVEYGVKDEHYAMVGEALIWTLGAGLKEAFTEEVKIVWLEAFEMISKVMKNAAATVG